ncbi:hypothetical protein GGS23DRAFT_7898 [Durotheca rogersii]|uniref:uncharacterized protein n=1 Tax=Durotheca rogersii TaxID=419775 RepID=UPI002220A903|nr:uncharacterized protein GGS23DRAFT_7898 [Durotheca rogersii]KAI5868025.1 hypothetical protein GGS23DRAFT_7898 [Durotheca rogersii]
MPNAHEAFKALGPINWDGIAHDQLQTFLSDIFHDAHCVIDSIPVSLASSPQMPGRLRSATDPDLPTLPSRTSQPSARVNQLRKEWKEVKVNPRENPLGLDVYKLAAKDGKGAWFARRSVHEGLSFEKWKLCMEKELDESMKVQGKPGDGSIRGIGADKRVVSQAVQDYGKMQFYQLSAQFPGPTTPRDFTTLLLSSDSALNPPPQGEADNARYFILVSRPCIHPECPPRQGFIRGQYESVEFIREIRIEKSLRKTRSSIDVTDDSAASVRSAAENISRQATIRSAHRTAIAAPSTNDERGRKRGKTIGSVDIGDVREEDESYDTVIEWLMVTRSDPGGSVPRFMIERGTPPGIAGDAHKFVKWISSKSLDDFNESSGEDAKLKQEAAKAEEVVSKKMASISLTSNLTGDSTAPRQRVDKIVEEEEEEGPPGPMGFYGMMANALGTAASVAASHIPYPFGSTKSDGAEPSDLSSEASDDSSSVHSFHSLEAEEVDESSSKIKTPQLTPSVTTGAESTRSTDSLAVRSTAPSQHEKELRKLEERKRKIEEKLQREQEKARSKRDEAAQRSEAAAEKLRRKHEREVARQREKHERELRKMEAKREGERKKAEERRRKAAEREEKASLAAELERARAERDVALKQVEVLKEAVGDLQAQNTMLVARFGRDGTRPEGAPATPPERRAVLRRSATDQPAEHAAM